METRRPRGQPQASKVKKWLGSGEQVRKGDVLVIDDRATMHRAHGDYDRSQARVLWRVIAEGDRPVLV